MKRIAQLGWVSLIVGIWTLLIGQLIDSPGADGYGTALTVTGCLLLAAEIFAAEVKRPVDTKRGRV